MTKKYSALKKELVEELVRKCGYSTALPVGKSLAKDLYKITVPMLVIMDANLQHNPKPKSK